ncbi:hypothetical protein V6x_34370 [Gimesia chilikensis]|uniref:WD40 repeat domain-containing protein n=1 Tax=Gimesia chilikensis TaxID=2605989 RepID=A0A517WEP0_9PLAN|nr:PD40 domain-containing protein [Gimesia chilikensis]QDU03714.1 hypothetical protein V6x_34370 [Gimesia chilikensis]
MSTRSLLLLIFLLFSACGESPQSTGVAWSLAFSPQGDKLLAVGRFENVTATRVYEMTSGRTLNQLTSLSAGASGATWSPAGTQIFYLNLEESRIDLFDLQQQKVTSGCHCDFFPQGTLSLLNNNELIVAPCLIADFQPTAEPPVITQAFCPEGKPTTREFGGCDAGTVFRVSTSHRAEGPVAVSYAGGCPVEVWDYRDGDLSLRYEFPDLEQCWIKVSADGQQLATLGLAGLSIWNLTAEEPKPLVHFSEKRISPTGFHSLAAFQSRLSFSQDGHLLAVCFEDSVQVIDLTVQKVIFDRQFHQSELVLSCALSPDGKTLAWSGNRGMGIRLQAVRRRAATE